EEQEAVCSQGEGDRIAEQHEDDQREEHDWRHVLGDERDHERTSSASASTSSFACSCADMNGWGSSMWPFMTAIFLMISETPWIPSSRKPISSIDLAGHRMSPPELVEYS